MVEGSLTVALVAFGGGEAPTVAAVLLYRLISFWVPLPVGGGCYLGLLRARRQACAAPLGGGASWPRPARAAASWARRAGAGRGGDAEGSGAGGTRPKAVAEED